MMIAARGLSLVIAVAAASCYDPVHLDAVVALGEEKPGILTGALHRAGQPCLTCHGGEGPANLELAAAGTIVVTRGEKKPLVGGRVTITDARGDVRSERTNGAGNFHFRKGDWPTITFPLRVVIEGEGLVREMTTTIGRDGGCATCHRDDGDRTLMPDVFLRDR